MREIAPEEIEDEAEKLLNSIDYRDDVPGALAVLGQLCVVLFGRMPEKTRVQDFFEWMEAVRGQFMKSQRQ